MSGNRLFYGFTDFGRACGAGREGGTRILKSRNRRIHIVLDLVFEKCAAYATGGKATSKRLLTHAGMWGRGVGLLSPASRCSTTSKEEGAWGC